MGDFHGEISRSFLVPLLLFSFVLYSFYNTLFDENAACHLALGMGFANCIRDFETLTLEECRALGVNDSIVHEDFMIGTKDLNIDGIDKQGKIIPVFRNGNWAF